MTLAHERTTQFFDGTRRQRRQIVTPEGVPLTVELAEIGERAGAFFIDIFLWFVALIAVYVPVLAVIGRGAGIGIAISIALFFGFLIRNCYFSYFEIAWRGATPGKRWTGLRVIDHQGGPLVASAVLARNLTREVEMFLPLGILITWGGSAEGSPDWGELALAIWCLFFAALPLINRNRMRGGDLIAGTMVIALPKQALSADLVESAMRFAFNDSQLKAYGAFELQVLEELLRRPDAPDSAWLLRDVCDKICRKIGWTEPVPAGQILEFLRDFYTAERAYLEREQLYGKARADKYSQPGVPR
jgi:uncharacterized RDD family membrane protein YckC